MSVQAIGTYFDKLVELRGLKIRAVSKHADVGENYISRLRTGEVKEPSAKILQALTEAVGGSWNDIEALLDPNASTAQAEALAEAWYSRFKRMGMAEQNALKRRLIEAIRPLIDDPSRLDDLLGH